MASAANENAGRTRGSWAERGFNPRGSTGGFYGREYGWTTRGEANRGDRETGRYSGRGPRGYQRSDERVYEEVCDLVCQIFALHNRHAQVIPARIARDGYSVEVGQAG